MKYELYEVGGRVRDYFLGMESKDVDYSVVITDPILRVFSIHNLYDKFVEHIKLEGYNVFVETPDMFTVRAKFPNNHQHSGLTADFVLCRKESDYVKGTRKPSVSSGTLLDDLQRRDFTVNAMARATDGTIIDPFGGQKDLQLGILRTPIDSAVSFNDDPLRILRGFRFAVTKNLNFSDKCISAIKTFQESKMDVVSTERIRTELEKMFKHNTSLSLRYLRWLEDMNPLLFSNIMREGMWLLPTNKS